MYLGKISSRIKIIAALLRPKTLFLSLLGSSLASTQAYYEEKASLQIFLLTCLCATLLQALSNIANDLGDTQHGADNPQRKGPIRPLQKNIISYFGVLVLGIFIFSGALGSGIYLLYLSLGMGLDSWIFFGFGCLALMAAIKYTYGKNPYGYRAWGDPAVFIFFGPLLVGGGYFLHTQSLSTWILIEACLYGILCVWVLHANNLRDLFTDRRAKKITCAVRLGPKASMIYYLILAWITMMGFPILHVLFMIYKANTPLTPHLALGHLVLGSILLYLVYPPRRIIAFLIHLESPKTLPRILRVLSVNVSYFILCNLLKGGGIA
ncbi:MAG: 1,4-dihydroxy-2-naphthoate octaprenyltransferase [Cytophagales bacterium]|nr:1,4-dihydroxy-2-naphthoate octaprenyltransferase [Cytophagales bacterium]